MAAQTPPRTPTRAHVDGAPGAADRALRWAWLSLLLYPVSFVGAFVVGEGLSALLDERSPGPPSMWENLAAAVPALVLFAVPGVLAVGLGRRAMRLGRPRGREPAVVGVVVALAFVGLNVLALLAATLSG